MLATLGFIITGLCFGIFAYTFNSLVVHKLKLKVSTFSLAYYALALALVTWGICAAIGGNELLKRSVIVGDAFLLIGTLCMLNVWLDKRRKTWLWLAALVSILLLYARVAYFSPTPALRGGILIFNTQTTVAVVVGLLFTIIWLPINLRVAKQVTQKIGQKDMNTIYSSMYVTATAAVLIFLAARRIVTVVLSFVAIGICFVMLIGSNILLAKIADGHHGK